MLNLNDQPKERSIRVFVSSTFRDMIQERNYLVKNIFPKLRNLCRERDIEFTEIDLRWGVTAEEVEQGKVIEICLREIDRCRPYFIGILGERYGWIPLSDEYEKHKKIIEDFPWVKGDIDEGISITEMEIQYGVLRNPSMKARAFFYFRKADSLPEEYREKPESKEAKKLERLKSFIKEQSSYPSKEFENVKQLEEVITNDFTAFLDKQFPIGEKPTPLERTRMDHAAFARSRMKVYIGGEKYFKRLDEHIESEDQPLIVTGKSGNGKSALLANWIAHYQQIQPDEFVIYHFIGGAADSSDHYALMRRIMEEMKQQFEMSDEIPVQSEKIAEAFANFLTRTPHSKRWILVIDALNQLEEKDNARWLGWLPKFIPANIRVIISTLPGEALDEIRKREYLELEINPLDLEERKTLIREYLSLYARKLTEVNVKRIAEDPESGNPLILRTILDELKIFGVYEQLDERIGYYLKPKNSIEFFNAVLERLESDYEEYKPGMVGELLSLIWAARRGLTENEILEITKIPPLYWEPLYNAIENHLVRKTGLLNFSHDFLRDAVEQRYLSNDEKKKKAYLRLADHFEALPPTIRSCDELPWLLKQSESFDRLRNCLLNLDCFLEIKQRDENELRGYWIALGEEKNMEQYYLSSFNIWKEHNVDTQIFTGANALAVFLQNSALFNLAETLIRLCLELSEEKFGELKSSCFINLAEILRETERYNEAEPFYRKALEVNESSFGMDSPETALTLINLALFLRETKRYDEAEPLYRRALSIEENIYGKNHPNVASDMENLAVFLTDIHRESEAENLFLDALRIYETNFGKEHPDVARCLNNFAGLLLDTNRNNNAELHYRRALKINEKYFGRDHPNVARNLKGLARLLYQTNRLSEAESFYFKSLKIFTDSYGFENSNTLYVMEDLALLLQDTNRINEAEKMLRHVITSLEKNPAINNLKISSNLNNLAKLLLDKNQPSEAELLIRKSLQIREKLLGENHAYVADNLNFLAKLLFNTNRINDAELCLKRAIKIYEDSFDFDKDHQNLPNSLSILSGLYVATNRMYEAEELLRRAIKLEEKYFGSNHPNLANDLNNLATSLFSTNRIIEAEPILRRALKIYEKHFGTSHPGYIQCLSNLAQTLQNTNRTKEAEPLYREVIKLSEKYLVHDPQKCAEYIHNLAFSLHVAQRLKEAEPFYQKVLKKTNEGIRLTGQENPHMVTVMSNYSVLLEDLGWSKENIIEQLKKIAPEFFNR